MNILTLISGGDVGGAKTHVLSLLRGISASESVTLVCFMEGEFSQDAREMGIRTIVMTGGIRGSLRQLRELIRRERFDIIHCHGSRGNFIGCLVKRFARLPLVSTVHSDYRLDYLGRPAARLTYGVLNALALRCMDFHIGVSDSMAELLIDRGFKPGNIFTIYNGIDYSVPLIGDRASFLSEHLPGLPEGSVNVGIAARLNPVKDIATLIRGFVIAAKDRPKMHLLIAGDGEEREMLGRLAAELGVAERVHFLGWVSDMDGFYASLDINTLSSLSETFPYVLTEGSRFRLPTVSSTVGGVPKLIDEGVNGFLFAPGDFKTLGLRLGQLADSPELRRSMGEKLHEKAKRLYSLDATCRTQLDIYAAILRRSARRAKGVTICGAYGMGNSGDDAILDSILSEIRSVDPDIPVCVLSKSPRETRRKIRAEAVHTFNIFSFLRAAMRSQLYINGGGSLIQDVTSRRSLWFYLYTIKAAKLCGCRVMMYGCGIGPLLYKSDRRLAGRIIDSGVDMITLREDSSLAELRDMGVTRPDIRLTADPVLSLEPASGDELDGAFLGAGLDPGCRYLCFSVRPWMGLDTAPLFAAAAEYAKSTYGLEPVFLPINIREDLALSEQIAAMLPGGALVLRGQFRPEVLIGLFSRMSAVVSMRLHGLIFSAAAGVPLAGVVYDPKVRSFMQYIGIDNFCDVSELESGALPRLIDRAVSEAGRARGAADAARAKERGNVQALSEILNMEKESV